ncbi:MAG: hypothetical protein WCD86_26710, partial [Ktedonobacteraceae bacterium]
TCVSDTARFCIAHTRILPALTRLRDVYNMGDMSTHLLMSSHPLTARIAGGKTHIFLFERPVVARVLIVID